MRRVFSLLLVLLVGVAPVLGAMPASAMRSGWTGKQDESRLPACCRRHGQHHCMMDALDGESGPVAVAPNSCPCPPRSLPSTAPSIAALPGSGAIAPLSLTRRRALQAGRASAWANERRAWPKRGPPLAI